MTHQVLPSRRSLLVRSISRPAAVGIVAGAVAAVVMPLNRAS